MKNFGRISLTVADGVARATIDWPAPLGSMREDLLEDFTAFVDWLEDEGGCDALLVSAQSEVNSGLDAEVPDIEHCRKWEKLLVRIDRASCISVALVEGACNRFWMQLALACDHRIVSADTTFRVHEVKEGYLPGMNIFRLAKYVGVGVARRMVFTGEPLDAAAAAAFGIADQVSGRHEMELVSRRFVERLRPIHPVAVQLARRLLNESFATAFEDFLGNYLASQRRCLAQVVAVEASGAE
jgi:enoyl-CoA hydratase/carnithine racemase